MMQIETDDFIQNNNNNKNSKTVGIIITLIVVTIIAVIAIICAIMMLKDKKLSVVIDGNLVQVSEDTFIIDDNGKVYVSIRDIAPLVGYEAHNGEYKIDIEDTNKMYVEAVNETETASFFLNDGTIKKVAPDSNEDYDNVTINGVVTKINDKFYVPSEGFTVGFNSLFNYNIEQNRITIQTLPYLVSSYEKTITQYGYSKLTEEFNGQKALVYGMIVASKEANGKYGVITIDGNEIISPRYNKIEFIESSGEFIITNSSEKVGIALSTGKTKITVSYDEIKLIDSNRSYYLVKSNNKYGIINAAEKFIVHIEYDEIGIDTSKYSSENIKNQYILYDNIIPAKLNNKWVLLTVNGERLTNEEYDEVGCTPEKIEGKVADPAVIIGETGTVIVAKDKKYGGVDVKGNVLIPLNFDAIYSVTTAGKTSYYIYYNKTDYSAEEYINVMKQRLGYEMDVVTTDEQNSTEETQSQNNENTNTANVTTNQSAENTAQTSENVVSVENTNQV